MSEAVVISYVNSLKERVQALLTIEDARMHWNKLPQPLQETYSIRSAVLDDFKTWEVYQFTSDNDKLLEIFKGLRNEKNT